MAEPMVERYRRVLASYADPKAPFAGRELHYGFDADGFFVFKGRLPAEQATIVRQALEAAARPSCGAIRSAANAATWARTSPRAGRGSPRRLQRPADGTEQVEYDDIMRYFARFDRRLPKEPPRRPPDHEPDPESDPSGADPREDG